jgi:hypothetical protein
MPWTLIASLGVIVVLIMAASSYRPSAAATSHPSAGPPAAACTAWPGNVRDVAVRDRSRFRA